MSLYEHTSACIIIEYGRIKQEYYNGQSVQLSLFLIKKIKACDACEIFFKIVFQFFFGAVLFSTFYKHMARRDSIEMFLGIP